MPLSRVYRILILAGIPALFISYLAVWIRFINNPVERTGADFISFYSAGRVAQEEGYSKVYDPLLQQDIQEEQVGFPLVEGQVLLYNHLPFLLPILRLIASDNYVNSLYRWDFLLLVIYIFALIILSRTLYNSTLDSQSIWVLGIGSFLFLPLFFSLMNGQDTAILLLGTALWMYGLTTDRELLAGLGLSITTVKPHISLMLAIPMLFSYSRVFWTYLLGSTSLLLLSILIIGLEGARGYIDILLISAGGEWHGLKEGAMFNLIGLLTRTMPFLGADSIRAIGWLVYALAILGLSFFWAQKRELKDQLVGTTVVVALFTVPHLHSHDLALLVITFYALIRISKSKTSPAVALPIALSLVLLISNSSVFLQYSTPYIIMLALFLYIVRHMRKNSSELHRS